MQFQKNGKPVSSSKPQFSHHNIERKNMSYHEVRRASSLQQVLTHLLDVFAHLLGIALPAAMFAFAPGANAQDAPQPGDTAYYCERSGSYFWTARPCEDIGGTELRRGVVGESGTVVESSESSSSPADAPSANARSSSGVPGNATAENVAQAQSMSAEKSATENEDIMKHGRKSLLKLLGFAFVFAILAKLTGRSFFRWFLVGAGVHFLLVALNVFSL